MLVWLSGQYPCGRLGKAVKEQLGLQRSVITANTVSEYEMTFHHNTSSENNTLSLTNDTASSVSAVVNTTEPPTVDSKIPHWLFYPTLATIKAESSIIERIVGGKEATPGEIPWQVRTNRKITVIVLKYCNLAEVTDHDNIRPLDVRKEDLI